MKRNQNSTFFKIIIVFLLFVVFNLLFFSIISIGLYQLCINWCYQTEWLKIYEFVDFLLLFFNSYSFIIFWFVFIVWIIYLFYDIINMRFILSLIFFIFLSYLYFKFNYKEPVLLLCEENKTKLFWYTYKFGIIKYLIADQNEIGSILFNTVTRKPNEILIPTGYINIKKGFDSILFNLPDGTFRGLQYKYKYIDMSILNEKQFRSMVTNTFKNIAYCDQLVVDTNSTNINVLHDKLNSSYYDSLRSLIKENKIIIYDSDQWLIDQNDEVIASSIKGNSKAIETLIIEKNIDAGDLVHQIHEAGADPRFHELGNLPKGKLEQMRSFSISSLDRGYIDIHLKGIKIINETVANEILKIKK